MRRRPLPPLCPPPLFFPLENDTRLLRSGATNLVAVPRGAPGTYFGLDATPTQSSCIGVVLMWRVFSCHVLWLLFSYIVVVVLICCHTLSCHTCLFAQYTHMHIHTSIFIAHITTPSTHQQHTHTQTQSPPINQPHLGFHNNVFGIKYTWWQPHCDCRSRVCLTQ